MSVIDRVLSLWQARSFWRPQPAHKRALALSGGGVIGGMYEVGALAALEERLGPQATTFDIYVGCSAGSVVASLLANGIRATEIYRVLDQDLDDPLNFRRRAVFAPDSFRYALSQFSRMVWAFGKNVWTAVRDSVPDMLKAAEPDLPAGFFSLDALELFMREAFASRGVPNAFDKLDKTLLIPAVDLDRAERVVFGLKELRGVPISRAIAASSAIPGFFVPYRVDGHDYIDGGIGFSGHADLAAEAGADLVLIIHPLVPSLHDSRQRVRDRGVYSIMDQAGRIYGQNLLQLGLAAVRVRFPSIDFFLLEPPRSGTPLLGPSMGFEAARNALQFGYSTTSDWLEGRGARLVERVRPQVPVVAS